METTARICLVPQASSVGGPRSFQRKFAAGLEARGVEICHDLGDTPYDAVLVVGGTRHLLGLRRAKKRGVPIIQRLDGMNWLHRRRRTGLRHFLKAEYGNWLLDFIRRQLATGIVYQSQFVADWWERSQKIAPTPHRVIHNGVDLSYYTPEGAHERPTDRYRLLVVEGNLGGGYELGLQTAVELAERLHLHHDLPVELMVVGGVSASLREGIGRQAQVSIIWAGQVPAEHIPYLDRSAHLLYSADLNAACPNAVIEALACGLPVLAFDTGALPELVSAKAGRIVPYGGDPWRLQPPDLPALAEAAVELLEEQARYRAGARLHAEAHFGLDVMVNGYLEALLG
jgi:glycosyltransferase involved in cell wall biosynthesis